jgi:hypothetical protein
MEMPSETKSIEVSIMKQHAATSEDCPHSHMTVALHLSCTHKSKLYILENILLQYSLYINSFAFLFL